MAERSASEEKNHQGPPSQQSQRDGSSANGPVQETGQRSDHAQEETKSDLTYDINETPPWYVTIVLGFQHYLTMFGSTLGVPLLLATDLCMSDNLVDIGKLIQTEFFISGLATLLQTMFGSRLPIVQGASVAFLGPAQAILRAQSECPERLPANATEQDFEMRGEFWRSRMRLLQGAILIASIVEVVIGFTGLIGFLLRFIGPLTIAPTLCLIGLSLFQTAAFFAGGNWLLAIVFVPMGYRTILFLIAIFSVIVSMTIFSQYLNKVSVPLPWIWFGKKFTIVWFPVFKLLPVILSILLAWILAAILTATDSLPEESSGRTDSRLSVLTESPWFYIPYPFQWGVPVVTIAGVLGMVAGVLASTVESIGDYFACARVSGAPPPPDHAVNRGIGMEGIGCILAGFWGTGLGTTSYSQNIGAINITKVGSRRVIQAGALFMIFLGTFGKFGAFFATIPVPIIGGMFCVLFGLVTAVGLSSLQFVDLNSSRNLFVLGSALFLGLVIPTYISGNPGAISTRSTELNQILTVLLSTNMFVGGLVAAVLDNTIPGTIEERGIVASRQSYSRGTQSEDNLKCYDFPFGMDKVRSVEFFKYLPFSPTFQGFLVFCKPKHKSTNNGSVEAGVANDGLEMNE